MATEVELKKQRTQLRRQLTIAMNKTNECLVDPTADGYKLTLKAMASILKPKATQLEDIDNRYILFCDDEDAITKETTEAARCQMDCYLCLAEIEAALEKTSGATSTR